MVQQYGDVILPFPQWGYHDRHHVQAVKQVLAELSFPHQRFDIPVGGSHYAHIHIDGLMAAHFAKLLFLKDPEQLGLHTRGNLADLIQ